MPSGTLHYRFRIRTGTDEADLFYASSVPGDTNPFIAEPPSGDGASLDPLTGKVSVGAYTVKVIDAPGVVYTNSGSALADGLEYANLAAATSGGWTTTDTLSTGSVTWAAVDQVHGGSRSLKFSHSGTGIAAGGKLEASKTFDSGDGIVANTLYTVSVYGRMSARSRWDVNSWLVVNGVTRSITTAGAWQLLTVTVRSSEDAELHVALRRAPAFVNQTRDIWWDDLSIQALAPSTTLEGRVVTSVLADTDAKQQLMSKPAIVEESEDEGATWTVLTRGYVNHAGLNDALLWEFTVGDSKRVEQSRRVFDRITDPSEFPEFIGTLDRASCLMGGPIVGDWGGFYRDRGRPAFEVLNEDFGGSGILNVGWTNDGGSLHAIYKEDGPPMADHVAEFINDAAREYVDPDVILGSLGILDFALAPDLICRIYDYDTSAWVIDVPCVLRRLDGAGFDTEAWGLVSSAGHFSIQWDGGSVGDKYRFAVFPRTISDRNPAHWSGHPMDLVANIHDYIGRPYNLASLQAMGEYLGPDLRIHLRIKQGDLSQPFLENTVYGLFGIAPRLNDDGEVEFVPSRSPDTASVSTITEDELAGELAGNPWQVDEASAANRVIVETHAFIPDTRRPDSATPFDAIRDALMTCDIKPPETDENAIYGDKEIRFTLPGSIQVAGAILKKGPPKQESAVDVTPPGTLDVWCANVADPIFTWQGRGGIRADLNIRRGQSDARIGDVITVDCAYFPSADPLQSPVSQRGTNARRAVVLQRTNHGDFFAYTVEDRGLAETLDCLPEFTLAADATFPKTTVEVTVTNTADLDHNVRVEMAVGAIEPAGHGQFVRLWVPDRDPDTFDLPPVCAGNVVWVRMRCELNGQVGTWSDWDSIDLDDLTAPSSLSAVVNNTSILLSWTNGETTYPVEVLARLDTDTTLQSVAVLPAGSTSYTLLLTEASTDYTVGVRYVDQKGCTSATTTVSATTDVAVCLEPPTNLAAFADGAGTYGVELDATVVPGGVDIWVAIETAVGSGTPGTYTLVDSVVGLLPPLRTRWTASSPAPNDGLLRYIKAESSQAGYTACDFSSVVSIDPWTLVDPNPPEGPDDPNQTPGLANIHQVIPMFRPGIGGGVIYQPGAERTPFTTWRGTETKVDLTGVTAVRLIAQVAGTTMPSLAYIACEFELVDARGSWQPMDGVDLGGPIVEVDSTSLDERDDNADEDAWNVTGDWVEIVEDAAADVRLRLVVAGGTETEALILGDVDLEVFRGSFVDVPIETPETPTEDPGSCDTPSPVDMNTGWTGGDDTGAAWSAGTDSTYTLTMDGSGTGDNYWEQTLTGLTAGQLYTFYLTVDTADVGVRPFLQVVGGDTDEATDGDGEELVARGTADGSGNLTVRWGVQDLAGSAASASSDTLQYADKPAAESGGWTVTDTMAVGSITFDTGHAIAGSGLSSSIVFTLNGVGNSGTLSLVKSYNVGAGSVIRGKLWAEGTGSVWEFLSLRVANTAGTTTNANNKGSEGVEHLATNTVTAGGDGLVTVTITMGAVFPSGHANSTWYFAGLTLEGAAGAAVVDFSDLGSCLGTGKPQDPIGGDVGEPDPPDVDVIPEPPGGYPPPPVGGDRPFGCYNIPTRGLGYWNSTIKVLKTAFAANTLNETTTYEAKNMFVFGATADWLTGGKFDFNKWKAIVDSVANHATIGPQLEQAIDDGYAFCHHVIDEPYHLTRYGGPIPIATVEKMCVYSKSIWPTWPTMLRVAPTFPWITRHISGCDWLWAEYLTARGDVTAFRDANLARVTSLGFAGTIFGLHYKHFTAAETGRDITPSEILHYGKILASGTPSLVPAFSGWRFDTSWYNVAGAADAVRQLRDYFAGKDP